METVYCPVCGSTDLKSDKAEQWASVPYGEGAPYLAVLYHCNTCGTSGDFGSENEEAQCRALQVATKKSIESIVSSLNREEYSAAYIERALELPERTIARWRTGAGSAAAVALLRIVKTFPWILHIAERRFNPSVARVELLIAAASAAGKIADEESVRFRVETWTEPAAPSTRFVFLTMQTNEQATPKKIEIIRDFEQLPQTRGSVTLGAAESSAVAP